MSVSKRPPGVKSHTVIDSTGLKVFGEGEWKVKKHGRERRRIWRKLHLAVDSKTHEMGSSQKTESMVTPVFATPILTTSWLA